MIEGWIKIYRKIIDSKVWDNPVGLKIWLWCLIKANHKECDVVLNRKSIHLNRGQFVFGRMSASEELRQSPSTVRNWILFLKQDSCLDIKPSNKYSIITVINYDEYQSLDSNLVSKITAEKKQNNTANNVKNDKNINTYVSLFNEKFKTQYTVTSGRDKKLSQRLKKFTLEEILKAIENLSKSNFHTGDNDRGWKADPDFLIRSDEQIDKWLNTSKSTNKPKDFNSLLKQ